VLAYVRNAAPAGQPARFELANLQLLTVEGFRAGDEALLINADGDSDVDMLVGKGDGTLQYHENTGNFSFVLRNPQAGGIGEDLLRQGLSLAVGDLTRDGQPDLVTGDRGGNLVVYPNFLTNLNGTWSAQRSFIFNPLTNSTGVYSFGFLSGGVLPGVYQTDLILGTTAGGLRYLRPRNVVTSLPDDGLAGMEVGLAPNPAAKQVRLWAARPARVHVYSLVGAPVWEGQVEGEYILEVGAWAAGVYLVKFAHGGGSVVRKLVVHR
jgi:FG-GAP-like repeat